MGGAVVGVLAVTAAIATPLLTTGGTPSPAGSGGEPAAGNVFLDPAGSDTAANCTRYATPQPDPGGAVCATFDKAYTLAQTGDTVLIRGGSFTTQQTVQVADRKPDGASCNYLGDTSGCITFEPEQGAAVSFDVANLPSSSAGNASGQLTLNCATYFRLRNITFAEVDFTDTANGGTDSHSAFEVGPADSTCGTVGPPHDDIFEGLTVGGAGSLTGGIYNSCLVDSHAVSVKNLPWHFSQAGYDNGKGAYAHDNCMIGNTFDGFNFVDNNGLHMECVTMFSSGSAPGGMSNNVIRNNKFLDCPIEGFFMQIDNPVTADNNLFEGNLFKGSAFPLKISCHSSGCQVTNTTVRFNTFQTGSNFTDCNGGCTWTGDSYYGNLTPVCALTGWAGSHNVFAGSSCATDDGTSTFNATPASCRRRPTTTS